MDSVFFPLWISISVSSDLVYLGFIVSLFVLLVYVTSWILFFSGQLVDYHFLTFIQRISSCFFFASLSKFGPARIPAQRSVRSNLPRQLSIVYVTAYHIRHRLACYGAATSILKTRNLRLYSRARGHFMHDILVTTVALRWRAGQCQS